MIRRFFTAVHKYNPQARLFFAVVVGAAFVVDGVYTVILNLYMLRLGYGTELIGLVNAAGLLSFALTSLPAGILGSRFSNTRLMKLGVGISLLGGLLLPLVEALPPGLRASWLVLHYALALGGFSLFFVNGAPYLINVVDRNDKHKAFALKMAHWALAGFAGSLFGGIAPGVIAGLNAWSLNDPAPYRLTLTTSAVVLGLSFLLALRIRPLPRHFQQPHSDSGAPANNESQNWTLPLLMLIGIMTVIRLFQVAGSATALVYFNVYMDRQLAVSTAMIGVVTAIGRLSGVPTALITPWMVQRWGNVKVVIWSSLLASICLVPMALVEHWLAAGLGLIVSVAMMSVRYTALVVYLLDLVPRAQQSVMAGAGEMAAGLSFAIMALGGGFMLSLFSFRDLFLLGAFFSFIGTALFWLYVRGAKPKRKLQPAI